MSDFGYGLDKLMLRYLIIGCVVSGFIAVGLWELICYIWQHINISFA